MRIAFLLTRRVPDVPSPVLAEVARRLREAGHTVTGWIPEDVADRVDDLRPSADLYLLKSHTELAVSVAGVLHDRGAAILNDYHACLLAQDKFRAAGQLREADVATPPTWATGDLGLAVPFLAEGPLVVKPHRGHRGVGVHVVHTVEELAALTASSTPVVVQRHVPGPGADLKVYVAGDVVHAVRKPFAPDSFSRPGVPVPVTAQVHRLAQRVRRAFGLELFGVDVIEGPEGPVVVDVNYFPGYKGCHDPARGIADVVLRAAREGTPGTHVPVASTDRSRLVATRATG